MVLKRALSGLFVFTLASGMLFAQSSRLKVAHTTHTGQNTAAPKTPAGLTVIFTNIGPTPSNAYNDTTGYYILGPDNSVGLSEQAIGVPFTPRSASHVTELTVAVGWISGTKLVNVGLYSDSGGTVGTLLAGAESSAIPAFGTCCGLVSVTIPSTAVAFGTQYWIVASSDDVNAPDFTGVYQAANNGIIAGDVAQAGWFSFTTNTPAAAAKGTVP
ncbi:MAG TPA: hypothetical protein VGM18_21365 [Candidatus Sulfotelmatobacter sp.]|jgi:hypothetical protein